MHRIALLLLLALSAAAERRSDRRDEGRPHHASYCATCERDDNGKIKRNPAQRRAFRAQKPCPATGKTTGACPGYVIDHVIALKRGGPDVPANMPWQTIAEARAKDRVE